MLKKALVFALFIAFCPAGTIAQEVPVLSFTTDANGQALLTVASTADHYYVLHVRHSAAGDWSRAASITLGKNGSTILTEPLAAYGQDQYRVTEHLRAAPADTDGDGLDDMQEWAAMPTASPLNAAPAIPAQHGLLCVPDRQTFGALARHDAATGIMEIKFYLHNRDAAEPALFFINSQTHSLHTDFAAAVGYFNDGTLMTGSIIFHPALRAPSGALGAYRFVFQPNNAFGLRQVQKAMELLASNMPFLKNNLCYYPLPQVGLPLYMQEKQAYDASRVCVLLEADLYQDVDYMAMHPALGYGLLRRLPVGETPGGRDIVVCEALPNDLPRVGGIVSAAMQTPLSHVNLRAIQYDVPNAFVRDAHLLPNLDSLMGRYVRYEVAQQGFSIRAAQPGEVDAFYEAKRPVGGPVLQRDLGQTRIKPLDSIGFAESARFGAKCANVATMRGFGFPEGTIPDGYGVPFYFYDAFMHHNGLYETARQMLAEPTFQADFQLRDVMLADFRKKIKNAPMPDWMLEALGDMQAAFPPGTSIRCRSSTNVEDLPGFSGAGLYDSKTQRPEEGHIAKSIKQVYASMWNFRAFDEREFYRIDHFQAAMGVLVHPNHSDERANGVGVSTDPWYQTEGTYYLNTQVGEDLVTNPGAFSIPEEMLLDAAPSPGPGFYVLSHSNLLPADSLMLQPAHLAQMRHHLGTIHERFVALYQAGQNPDFAMEIEYKINAEEQLVIKQARPWAHFRAIQGPTTDSLPILGLKAYPNPFGDFLHLECARAEIVNILIFNMLGQQVSAFEVDFRRSYRTLPTAQLPLGSYWLRGTDAQGRAYASGKLVKCAD
jgi:hypothetical protein